MLKKVARIGLWVLGGTITLITLAAGGYVVNTLNAFRWSMNRVIRAGFVEKQVFLGGTHLNYAEGPDNGPPLLLIHAQSVEWRSYHKVLPTLSQHFHVFAVDCPGHGKSTKAPEKYSAEAIGQDLKRFIAQVIGEPALVSGHSSGGVIAAWLASNAAGQVRGVVLEDPPLFTTVLPRAQKTWGYVDLASNAHNFLLSGEHDFVAYYLRHAKWWAFFKGGKQQIVAKGLSYRTQHPNEPLKIFFMPPSFNEMFVGLQSYDPRFGEAFYTGTWNLNFDDAKALAGISVPAVLIHTNWKYDEHGVLLAAMDDKDAERARSLIKDVQFIRADSGHGFHSERPRDFIEIMLKFKNRVAKYDSFG